ncbi:MAG TPA: phospho-N-acetylmuramoyl-pentapeptide-transferase [Thermoleophilaceae bacterium]
MLGRILIAGMASLFICIFLGPKFIQFLRLREFGQHIREEGPAGHAVKAGTPTMGGIVLFLAVSVPFLILSKHDRASMAVFGTALACAMLGFLDDWTKVSKKRSLGLSARKKLLVQAVIAIALWYVATRGVGLDDELNVRLFDAHVDLGYAYPVLIFLVLAGSSNGVNLTDGLDGLAAGCAAIVLLAYTAMTLSTGDSKIQPLALLCACLVGASVGFLWFNSFPAAVFMGDTGSLGLGGAIAAMAVMTQTEVLLLIIGGIFVIEALSVAIQVFSFQRFRKRVFLMAPVHHHFELMAWSETKIILRFWIVAAICSSIGFTLYQQSIN